MGQGAPANTAPDSTKPLTHLQARQGVFKRGRAAGVPHPRRQRAEQVLTVGRDQ